MEVVVGAVMAAAVVAIGVKSGCNFFATHSPAPRSFKVNMRQIFLLSGALLLAACSPLSVENYNKLKTGMSYEEVKKLLGAPAKCNDILGVKQCTWGDDKRHIDVNFIADQVLIFTAENIR